MGFSCSCSRENKQQFLVETWGVAFVTRSQFCRARHSSWPVTAVGGVEGGKREAWSCPLLLHCTSLAERDEEKVVPLFGFVCV